MEELTETDMCVKVEYYTEEGSHQVHDKDISEIEEKPFVCWICAESFQSSEHLSDHQVDHAENENRRLCDMAFGCKSELLHHDCVYTEETPYKCLKDSNFIVDIGSAMPSLSNRPKRHRAKKIVCCTFCDKHNFSSSKLKEPDLAHTDDKEAFNCEPFSISPTFYKNTETPKSKKALLCTFCDKHYFSFSKLNEHVLTHTGELPFKCDICQRRFHSRSSWDNHMKRHIKPYYCDICNKSFSQLQGFVYHQTIHSGERPFLCSFCGRRFSGKSGLDTHMSTHTGEKRYKCEKCGKAFSQKGDMRSHVRTHTGEKPYQCQICGKKFNHAGTLKRHLRGHTGEKQHICTLCDKHFTRKSSLIYHMEAHSKDKCEFCGKKFTCMGMRNHMRIHLRQNL